MTASEIETGRWLPVPDYSSYEACDRGQVRSVDRTLADGRSRKGVTLRTRTSNRGYQLLDMVNDDGVKKTVTLHSVILLTFAGPCPEGMEALHENDDQADNRWPENLRWGTHAQNVGDRMRNSPAAPRPVKQCVRCGSEFTSNGRRCHACVVQLGELAGAGLADGADLEKLAEELGYPSAVGLWRLAVRYGGLVVTTADDLNRQLREAAASQRPSWLHRVTTTLRARFGGGDTT